MTKTMIENMLMMRDPYIKQQFKAFKAMSTNSFGPSFIERAEKDD